MIEEIGKGGYGTVFKVQCRKDDKIFALKKISMNTEEKQAKGLDELSIMKKCHNKNIVKYFGSFVDQDNMFLLMEYVQGGDL